MRPTVLYWYIDRPTEQELAKAKAKRWMLRNVMAYRPDDTLEMCDGVLGAAPAVYVERFGRWQDPDHATPAVATAPVVAPVAVSGEAAIIKATGRAYALHLGGGKWQVTGKDGVALSEVFNRSAAYAKARELNGEG